MKTVKPCRIATAFYLPCSRVVAEPWLSRSVQEFLYIIWHRPRPKTEGRRSLLTI